MRKTRPTDNVETPVASLIDVVFLLIIFFVVTASVEEEIIDRTIQLARAENVEAETEQNPLTITINVKENGHYNIANRRMSLRQLQNILYTTKQKFGVEKVPILIRSDGETPYRYIADLQETITGVGFYKVKLAAWTAQ